MSVTATGARLTPDPPETRYRLTVACIDVLKSGVSLLEAQFTTDEGFTAGEIADPGFRVACQRCPGVHALSLLNLQEAMEDREMGFMSIAPDYGMLAGVIGGSGAVGRTPESIVPLVPRQNIKRLSLSEAMASYAKVDERRRHAISRVGRNDPCPCGSGKKFKKCHGALGGDVQ